MYCSLLEQWFQTEAGVVDPGSGVVRTPTADQELMGPTGGMTRRSAGHGASLLLVCVLCLAGCALAAVAIAAPGHGRRHRLTRTVKTCRRTRHRRHCSTRHAGGKARSNKHRQGRQTTRTHGRVSGGASSPGSSTAPGTAGSAPSAHGSTPDPGTTPPGSPGGAPPAEAPTSPAGPARVQVTAEDTEGFRFVLSRTSVPAGKVIIEFVNHGQDEHNLHAVEPGAKAQKPARCRTRRRARTPT